MRKKGRESHQACGQNCDPLDENNDFTLGLESQTLLTLRMLKTNQRSPKKGRRYLLYRGLFLSSCGKSHFSKEIKIKPATILVSSDLRSCCKVPPFVVTLPRSEAETSSQSPFFGQESHPVSRIWHLSKNLSPRFHICLSEEK